MRDIAKMLALAAILVGAAGCEEGGKAAGPRELKLAYVMAPGGPAHEQCQSWPPDHAL